MAPGGRALAFALPAAAAFVVVASFFFGRAGVPSRAFVARDVAAQPDVPTSHWSGDASAPPLVTKRVLLRKGEAPGIFQVARATFQPGGVVEPHAHAAAVETFLGVSGACEFALRPPASASPERVTMRPGLSIVVNPGTEHSVACAATAAEPCVVDVHLTPA